MVYSIAARYLSYVPMPTASQVTASGTIVISFASICDKFNRYIPQGSILESAIEKIKKSIIFSLSKAGFVNIFAASQKRSPIVSRIGIVLLTPFIVIDCLSIWRKEEPSESVKNFALFGIATNFVATSILFYQNRSFSNFFHFSINAANVALVAKDLLENS